MKTIIGLIGMGIAAGIGASAGYWLWDEFLEDKVENLRDRLSKN